MIDSLKMLVRRVTKDRVERGDGRIRIYWRLGNPETLTRARYMSIRYRQSWQQGVPWRVRPEGYRPSLCFEVNIRDNFHYYERGVKKPFGKTAAAMQEERK